MKREVKNRITQQQFFNLCTYLKDNESLLKGMRTKAIQERILTDTGLKATRIQLLRAQESLGADWVVQRQARKAERRDADILIVARALVRLLRSMGEEPDDDLADLAERNQPTN